MEVSNFISKALNNIEEKYDLIKTNYGVEDSILIELKLNHLAEIDDDGVQKLTFRVKRKVLKCQKK